jgi:quercetin dioxygenase-like cupin family protein
LTAVFPGSSVGSKFPINLIVLETGMLSKLFWAGAFVCLFTAAGLAQDPTKVEPRHYKLDFENERVQVVSVHYGPREKSSLHEHPGGVVVSLTEGHLRLTDEDGKTREVHAKPGEVRWYAPFKHRVENLSDTSYDAVYIGVKVKLATASPCAKGSTTAMDAETARIITQYALTVEKP